MGWQDVEDAAYRAWDKEDWPTAAVRFEELVAELPNADKSAVWWFDLALAYKFLGDWPRAYTRGREAAARSARGEQDPAFWNLGIAATIMRDWATARDAWAGYGIAVEPGEGEIVQDFGTACVRLRDEKSSEVVWVRRICPTRARVLTVPVATERRYGEIVLHDGVPNGERIVADVTYPVFDELMLFAPSPLPTFTVTVTAREGKDIDELILLFGDHDLGAQPAGNFRILSARCSESSVESRRPQNEGGSQTLWLGAPPERAAGLLEEWRAAGSAVRSWSDLEPVEGRG
ncbi:tetratricopeptide repeat protein [Sinosporangium siamense]|uniref:Tetratricopeptide repeat protein n=1 Tax=Sinosporangium siamense TaxID=1367973 RepID=A0A919RDC8_9ACTN|nr:hypothetical protein [Sinosporangium siamense]GII91840.1 hypothetical protein Ssi02_20710 [Sinosporangium siamense]